MSDEVKLLSDAELDLIRTHRCGRFGDGDVRVLLGHIRALSSELASLRQQLAAEQEHMAGMREVAKEPCRWTQMDESSGHYNTCEGGYPAYIEPGLDPFPFCQHCGQPVELVPHDQWGDEHDAAMQPEPRHE